MKQVIILAGPTAVGKTAIALELAQKLNTEIISADSRQCYRGMAIGTAQPTAAERAFVKHHFVDEFALTNPQSAADFEQYALQKLDDIFQKNDTAIVCGGTGLYLKALLHGLDEMPPVDPEIARTVEAAYQEKGVEWLRQNLLAEDPETFAAIDSQNPARLLRALIFYRSTGKSLVCFRQGTRRKRPFEIHAFGINRPREALYQRINQRVDAMMEEGLLAEAENLLAYRNERVLNTVGYAELFRYLDGEWTLAQAVEKIKQHTRNYAKRQLTWFRNAGDYEWIKMSETTEAPRKAIEWIRTAVGRK